MSEAVMAQFVTRRIALASPGVPGMEQDPWSAAWEIDTRQPAQRPERENDAQSTDGIEDIHRTVKVDAKLRMELSR
jgi:hypothetical protein